MGRQRLVVSVVLGEGEACSGQIAQLARRNPQLQASSFKASAKFTPEGIIENTLVVLPTGLGKTFTAGPVMLNCASPSLKLILPAQFTIGSSEKGHPRCALEAVGRSTRSGPVTGRVGYLGVIPSN